MPHQCTNCGRAFDDGSKEMLSGCPDCGGNKFQFHPSGSDVPEEPDTEAEPPEPPGPDSTVAKTVGNAASTVRDLVGGGSSGPPDTADTPDPNPGPGAPSAGPSPTPGEDTAQADARSEVVSPDELSAQGGWEPTTSSVSEESPHDFGGMPEQSPADQQPPEQSTDEPDERPDLTELREELNEQFESIKVLSPGQYELNLMELYDREEYIIALQEDGRYTIQVPETWHE